MSSKVDQFLLESGGNNFTETAPRPPVPGEENEKESNGGMSTRSSASSHKSHVSHTSGRSNSSNKGDINPATPRKSNIDKNASLSCSIQGCDEEMDAPLGFEPEGSAANSPPFTENSTPPCSRWAKSLHMLLDDRDGVQLFRTFLDQEGIGTFSLEFWFACQGLKMKESVQNNTQQVIKVIYKKYIKSDKLPFLASETKKKILEHIQSGIDLSVFNAAQAEVEQYMANDAYPAFLKSDLFVQYFARGGESSNSSSGSNSARPVSSGPLPTLREDQELEQDDFVQPFNMGPPLSKSFTRTPSSDSRRQEVFSGPNAFHPRQVPYHNSYAPTSAQDSELQSLSSQDALTDDTRSLTDSSVDGYSYRESRRHRKSMKAMVRRAGQNKDLVPFFPKTERAPKDRTLAEVDPKKFAEQLIIKLQKVLQAREKEERVHLIMNQSDLSESIMEKSSVSSRNNTATSIVPLLTSSMIDEENADSILEEHCSRIWERSAQQTPSRSPGRHSPRSRSPDRFRKPLSQTQAHSGSSSMPGTLHTKSLSSKKRGEFYSSFDSGMGEDNNNSCSVETHKHIHHHHHHHHERERTKHRSKHKLEIQAQQHSMYCWGDAPSRPHGGARQKTMSRSHSDNCSSNLDSGISMIESVSQYPDTSASDPSRTKVIQWILDNENLNRGTSSAYTDSDRTSSTHKRSHKSSALNQSSQAYNKTCSKKSSGSHINRSASADSCSRVPWVPPGGGSSVMPNQPIVQDPSMPLMPPPNTRVQLEEVTRRLETDHSLKSKSFSGPSKDKRPGMPVGQARVPPLPTARTVPSDLDTSGDSRNEKPMKKSSSVNTSTSSRPDETVIGYYLFGEPIPYRITIPQPHVTLGQLKQLISKRGNFRYFVKTHSRDFDSEVVYEEIKEDCKILPVFDGKVVVKIDKIDDIDSPNKSTTSSKR